MYLLSCSSPRSCSKVGCALLWHEFPVTALTTLEDILGSICFQTLSWDYDRIDQHRSGVKQSHEHNPVQVVPIRLLYFKMPENKFQETQVGKHPHEAASQMSYAMVHFLNERDARQAFLAGEPPADPNVSEETGTQPRNTEEVPSGNRAQGQRADEKTKAPALLLQMAEGWR
ncbi:hypothetical protein N7G274_006758 [Stereocaulon virgatum]|uniref:Uncharacterized protein n=1 Tax=Stereocaulon virgatum TaxID=373712 RepID=A0ABR4A4G1_9LECA